ncbi:helicase-associated domain-containing protein [Arthrobacter sedimenti]|uniref:helicase-associated domain-containing protein n=1 Tax=Arthrobacter sedimenti TaxID=2694931 RepID=UPI000B362581|nr:helicase-associated domain-containing protein [Arthrobacter sedimenti]
MSAIRALAEQLALRSDDELRSLLAVRPDLILPPVPDFAALAARASTRVSLQRALDTVSRPQLQVLEAIVVLGEDDGAAVTRARLASAFTTADAEALDVILADLGRRALVVGSAEEGFLPVGALPDALGPYPAGLGRPFRTLARSVPRYGPALVHAVALVDAGSATEAMTAAFAAQVLDGVVTDPDAWNCVLAGAPADAATLLSRLRDAPVGSTATAGEGGASPAVRWLLDRCLLAPLDALHVELPRGVGMALRGHAVFASLETSPPVGTERTTRASLRDNAAFGAIAETLRLVTALLGSVAATPVSTLRSGGVGVRELRRVREALGSNDGEAAWLLELAAAVGLLTLDPDDSRWKTSRLDAWEALDRDAQWLLLVEGWLAVDRAPALVGSRLPDGTAINALAAEASRPDAPMVRQRFLAVATDLSGADLSGAGPEGDGPEGDGPEGDGEPAAGPAAVPVLTEQSVIALATWHQPRLHRRFARLLPGMLTEAASLGLTGSGALTDAGRLVAEGRFEEAADLIRRALPAPVSHVVLQADLTAVAPGYLQPEVARGLLRMSTPEGQGPATTYRFSADSIRSALDAGEDAESILAFLRTSSATEIPQALSYLVEDTASRYGTLRVGRAGSYLRTDDDAVAAAVLADPRAAALGILQVAPTVLVSPASPQELTALLRDLGFAPAADAVAAVAKVPSNAAEPAPAARVSPEQLRSRLNPWSVAEEEIAAQVTALRSARPGPADSASGSDSEILLGLETLRAAIRSRSRIRLGTADSEGNQVRQVLVPLSVSGGRLRVFDPEKQVEKVVSVHRVMDVEILEGSPADG